MNQKYLAEFYKASGYPVIRTESGYWYGASPQIYQSLPPTETRNPSAEELRSLFRDHKELLGVQFPNAQPYGMPACRIVSRDKNYGLDSLQRQFRQHVSKGREHCEIGEIQFDQLYRIGMPVNVDAMSRRQYRIANFVEPQLWRRFCDAGQSSPGAGVMAGFADGELAAYLVYIIADGTAYGLHMLTKSTLRHFRPNHLLLFTFTKEMISREEVNTVSVGTESMPAVREIDHFKRHAGYQQEPFHMSVVLKPVARFLLQSRVSELALGMLDRIVGGNHHIRRIRLVTAMANMTNGHGS